MDEMRWVELSVPDELAFGLSEAGPPDPWMCDDCLNLRPVEGRKFTLSIEEGQAIVSCAVEGCSGPQFEPDMLQMNSVPITLALRTEGGSYEYPHDVNVWFDVTFEKET